MGFANAQEQYAAYLNAPYSIKELQYLENLDEYTIRHMSDNEFVRYITRKKALINWASNNSKR